MLDSSTFNFQIGVGTTTSDELAFNIVTGAEAAGFSSSLLSVSAGTAAASIGAWAVESGQDDYTTETLSAISASSGTLGEVATGNYRLYIDTVGSGSTGALTAKVKNVNTGEWVTIGTGAGGTSVSATVGTGGTVVVDLGVGISFEIGDASVATSAAGTEAAVYSFTYAHSGNSVSSQDAAQSFMDLIDTASSQVSKALGYIGATVNRMGYQEASLSVAKVNTEASYNRIMNADMAFEQVEATKWAILQQTAVAMLAQANMAPQSILGLFR